jgi:hypothetical protein
MLPLLRSRVALFLLVGSLLIPLRISTLDGLTHVLTCREQVDTPFSLVLDPHRAPIVISAMTFGREAAAVDRLGRLCGDLAVDLRARILSPDRFEMDVPITNNSRHPWQGTVLLRVGTTDIPVGIGAIQPGQTETDSVQLRPDPGQHEVSGSLLIGP